MGTNMRLEDMNWMDVEAYLKRDDRLMLVVGVKGYANQTLYSASKHAVMGMTKALAREVQADGIRVHAVCPGAVDTGMAGDARPDLDRAGLISPEDVADAVLFLVTRRGNAVIDEIDIRRASSTPWA